MAAVAGLKAPILPSHSETRLALSSVRALDCWRCLTFSIREIDKPLPACEDKFCLTADQKVISGCAVTECHEHEGPRSPVMRNWIIDGGRASGTGLLEQVPNHLRRPSLSVTVFARNCLLHETFFRNAVILFEAQIYFSLR
jgi:hypothetical protein